MRSVAILFVVTNFAFSSACLHGFLYGNEPADTYCNVTSINGDVTVTDGCNGDCYCDWLEEVFTTGENVQIIVDSGNLRIVFKYIRARREAREAGRATPRPHQRMRLELPLILKKN